jgi:hypothetical protein
MGNEVSTGNSGDDSDEDVRAKSMESASPRPVAEFFSSAGKTIGQASGIVCGKLDDTFDDPDDVYNPKSFRGFSSKNTNSSFANPDDDSSLQSNPMSHLFAKALLNEVIDNPSTMTPAKMAEREKKLLKAQKRAGTSAREGTKVIGGQGTVRSQFERASSRILPPNLLSDQRMQLQRAKNSASSTNGLGKHSVTIGLMMSRRNPYGHPHSVTRQRAFDFNLLQDREHKFVSSTDEYGWRAGGGEKGGSFSIGHNLSKSTSEESEFDSRGNAKEKIPTPDTVHIPIIHIDCESETVVNSVIASIARGEVFIPHMAVMPEALGVNGISPPDLVVRFGCERDDELSPEEWPNWCLEFMHNQLYEYFEDVGARWMKRPFQLTLAKKVRWKTVKHMNQYFAKAETVINSWREMGPQLLQPELAHIDGGATPEEAARPHGIYLLRNGKPTNYFAPNFEPPYTTKMTRSLLNNVISKSWDKQRRDWSTEPIPYVTPSLLFTSMCGCADPGAGGFVAREATDHFSPMGGGTSFFDKSIDYNTEYRGSIQNDRQLLNSMKITREDSGITRSQLGNVRSPSPVPGRSLDRYTSVSKKYTSTNVAISNTHSRRSTSAAKHSDFSNYHEQPSNQNKISENSLLDDYDLNIRDVNEYEPQYMDDGNFSSPQHRSLESPSALNTPIVANSRVTNSSPKESIGGQINNGGHYSTGMSVAESQTTVPIMNKSNSNRLIEQQRERRKEREIEREMERRKIDQLEMAIQEKLKLHEAKKNLALGITSSSTEIASDPGKVVQSESPYDSEEDLSKKKSSKKDKKAKKERKKREKKERKERSRSAQRSDDFDNGDANWDTSRELNVNRYSLNNDIGAKGQNTVQEDVDSHVIKPISKKVQQDSFSKMQKQLSTGIHNDPPGLQTSSYLPVHLNGRTINDQEIQSLASMDYSMDTASMMGDGSLIGGQFAGDSSVFTMGTAASDNRSLLSYVTRSTVHDHNASDHQVHTKQRMAMPAQQEEDSVVDSEEEEEIPSDEDLFAIGWAKALDPNSGCYYYFTLDRTKTVWDNPLLQSEF